MIRIIHLSDFHIDSENSTSHKQLVASLIEDLKNYVDVKTLVVVTGDFLNQGGRNFTSNYTDNKFNEFDKVVLKPLIDSYPNLKDYIFLVPGNHDIQRDKIDDYRDIPFKNDIIKSTNKLNDFMSDFYHRNKSFDYLEEYYQFINSFYSNSDIKKQITYLDNSFNFKIDDLTIGVSCFNSSWLCYDDNDKGNIAIGEIQVENSIDFIKTQKLKIALIHHDFSFLSEIERSNIEHIIKHEYDLVFIGHTHEQETDLIFPNTGGWYLKSIGKSLTADKPKEHIYKNGYSIVEYYDNKIVCNYRKYDDVINKFISNNDYDNKNGVKNFSLSQQSLNFDIKANRELESQFKDHLNDLGANLSNKGVEKVNLDDVFVYPEFSTINLTDDYDLLPSTIDSEEIFNEIINNKTSRIIIFGEENSGKTTLCKILFKRLLNENKKVYPVLIDSSSIKSTNDFKNSINREIKLQYENKLLLKEDEHFLILDNFHQISMNIKYKNKLMEFLITSNFKFLIIWDKLITFTKLISKISNDINIYQIEKFGKFKRYEIIEKWVNLFSEDFEDKIAQTRYIDYHHNVVDKLVADNLNPSYPIFLLAYLQASEVANKINIQSSTSSYYFDVLIKSAIGKKWLVDSEINKIITYLSELSYFFFLKKKSKLSEDEVLEFHKQFEEKFKRKVRYREIITDFIEINILAEDNDYKFKYKHIYYYFIGKYLSNNLRNSNIRKIIFNLAERLYQTECSNIFLFLIFHSDDEYILECINKISNKLFEDIKPLNFSDDINYINDLVTESIEIEHEVQGDLTKNKKEYHKQQDKKEQTEEQTNSLSDIDLEDNPSEIDIISKINKVFKTIELKGEILKSRNASLVGEIKEEMVINIYNLGLRSLNTIFEILIEGGDIIKDVVINKFNKDKALTLRQKEDLARKELFNLFYLIGYSIFRKISSSISTKDLELTFSDIVNNPKNQVNYAYQLINLANVFEYSKKFPYDEVEEIKTQINSNPLPYTILRHLGLNFIRMIPMNEPEQQRAGNLLDISMRKQRLLSHNASKK